MGALERSSAGQHHHHDDAQGVDVTALVDRSPVNPLGREVGRAADDPVHLGQLRRHGLGEPRNPEVEDLKRAPGVEHQVRGLDIAMDHPGAVGGRQSRRDLRGQSDGLRLGQQAVLSQVAGQGRPGQQLHDQEGNVPVGAAVEDRHHIRVLEPGGTPSLPHEAFVRGAVEVGIDLLHLDRHVPAEHRVVRHPDLTDPARADSAAHLVAADQQAVRIHDPHTAGSTCPPLPSDPSGSGFPATARGGPPRSRSEALQRTAPVLPLAIVPAQRAQRW